MSCEIQEKIKAYANRFPTRNGRKMVRERTPTCHTVRGTKSAEMIMLHLRESGHPIFQATSALDRGSLQSKKGGKLPIHYNGDLSTRELLFRTIISVNQLCNRPMPWRHWYFLFKKCAPKVVPRTCSRSEKVALTENRCMVVPCPRQLSTWSCTVETSRGVPHLDS